MMVSVVVLTMGALAASGSPTAASVAIPASLVWRSDFASLPELGRRAEHIVVATMLPGQFAFSAFRSELDYVEEALKCRIESRLKGDLPAGALITIREPGGEMEIDGVVRQSLRPSDALGLVPENRYVLFLRKIPSRTGFEVLGGPQGSFEIRSSQVLVLDRRKGRTAWRGLDGLSLEKFLAVVKQGLK